MKWIKNGLIFNLASYKLLGGTEFAQSPQAITLKDRTRIYFSTRKKDINGKFLSHIAYADFDHNLKNCLGTSGDHTVIPLGARGTFDEYGIFPFSPFQDCNRLLSYTCGWSRRASVSVETATGFAESFDNGHTFQKLGTGQIFGASLHQPFLVGDSFVRKFNGLYHMWYMFGQKWVQESDDAEPDRVYKIGHAVSHDGIEWERDNKAIIPDKLHENECQALPSIIFHNGLYHMVFCYRDVFGFRNDPTKSYRLGYAYSANLQDWVRDDKALNLNTGAHGEWDETMMCYPHLYEVTGRIFLLYNGNEFGRGGFGMAELKFSPLFQENKSTIDDILNHFQNCDADFLSHLTARQNLNEYSAKLSERAIRIEAWNGKELIGLMAIYHNREENFYFISNISISKSYETQGIASQLLTLTLNHTQDTPIKLEVHQNNKNAINFYKKFGFNIIHSENNYDTMIRNQPI